MSRVISLAAGILLSSTILASSALSAADQSALENKFDAAVRSDEMRDWMKLLAAEPNNVGSPHDRANAESVLAWFKQWGWDAHIETFDVLYPTPITETLEVIAPKHFKVELNEPPIPGDSSSTSKDPGLPPYLAYQGDGDVTAELVYVNYGMQDDYKMLERLGIDVKGKIVIARYGSGWRGLKPKLAQDHGALGCIIYSDPADDGYSVDSTYPDGPARPPKGVQRGSVADMPLYAGDPLTPGVGATADAKRLDKSQALTLLKIPALPISYADAQVLLGAMQGRVVPAEWRGALPITYRVGPGPTVHLAVKSDWSLKTTYNVIATMKGSTYPDQWVVRGNHRDGWVFGATDPLSGQVAMLEEAKILGEFAHDGWRPKRTIIYTSWDGEEPGLLGSTEWAETHAAELKQKAVIYINSDSNARGFLDVAGSHDFEHFVNQVAADVTDPEMNVTVGERRRAKQRIDALEPGAKDPVKEIAKIAADPKKDFYIDALGSGSDYSAYLEHLGLPALNVGYGDEGDSGGVYHSRYDTFEHHSKFVDPGFVYAGVLAKTVGRMVIRLADAEVPVQRAGNFAASLGRYLKEVEKLAKDKREGAAKQAKLLDDHSFQLSADPTKTSGVPTALKQVPKFDLSLLDKAVARLAKSAKAYDSAFAGNASRLTAKARARLQALMQTIDQTLAPDVGLAGRPWYKNQIYAPGRFTGYGVKTLPGVREAIEDERFEDVSRYVKIIADALNAYSARLDQATAVLKSR
jgi:N-acetylated-alpha-linked acidic dipeptidase